MDVAIYGSILKWRGENPYELVDKRSIGRGNEQNNKKIQLYEKIFRQDIFHDKCVWVNQQKEDFYWFIKSRHPLISCFLCPDKHPYSKSDRRGTLIIMFSLGSFWAFLSCLFALYGAKSIGIDVKGLGPTKEVFILRLLCSMGNGIVLWFLDLSLTKIQACHCAETQTNAGCYIICKVFAGLTIWIYFLIAIFMFAFSLYSVIMLKLTWMFLMVFSLQFICSWLFQFVGLWVRFKRCWIRDHRMINENGRTYRKCPYYLTYEDYEEYRFANKLSEISPRDSARNRKSFDFECETKKNKKFNLDFKIGINKKDRNGSMDDNPLLLGMEDDDEVKNEGDIAIAGDPEEDHSNSF